MLHKLLPIGDKLQALDILDQDLISIPGPPYQKVGARPAMQNEPHILFVDDDLDTRELMACIFRYSGFRVSLVGSSLEASKLPPLPPIKIQQFTRTALSV